MTIFALGDSIVKGFGVGEENSFVNMNTKGIHTVNFGMNGATSDYGVSKLKDIYGDILVLYFGINDFLSNYSVDYAIGNLVTIFEYVDKEKLDVILCSPHRIALDSIENWTGYTSFISTNNKLEEYNQKLRNISTSRKYKFLDFYSILGSIDNYDDLFFDGIHPTKSTHNIMREELLRIL